MLQVLAAPVGVKVRSTGTALPNASYMVVVTFTGVVEPAGRFPPRSMFCVSAGGSADPTMMLSGPGGDVLGWPSAQPSTNPPPSVARFPFESICRSPSRV